MNTGPIERFELEMPFVSDKPKPVVLVGPNGSGKSTVLSFIVNALVAFKQHVYDDTEIEKGRVYRIRSPLGIRGGANFYSSRVRFNKDVELREWQLDRPKKIFEEQLGWTPLDSTWNQIPEQEVSHFAPSLGELAAPHKMEEELNASTSLFFSADRFEPPDWLNSESLSAELKLPELSRMKGRTSRRIFARNRLKPTIEWLTSTLLDAMVNEHHSTVLPVLFPGQTQTLNFSARIPQPGPSTAVYEAIISILRPILGLRVTDQLRIGIGDRHSRVISLEVIREGQVIRLIRDLLSLSAGESALFCLFAGIILDADQTGRQFKSAAEIEGILLIDEADLHLHLGLQYTTFPQLLALFPKIQFIMSIHSPLMILGMESALGSAGFDVFEMPGGNKINPESYSEFLRALDVFSRTKAFESQILSKIESQSSPVLLVEGKSDDIIIRAAWTKLNPNVQLPFEVIPVGIEPLPENRNGGAEMLRRCLEFLAIASDRTIVALFDNDRKGNEQFSGVNRKAFHAGDDDLHKKHVTKLAHALLLPVPLGRELFVTLGDINQRYLSIEHYFSDKALENNRMCGPRILGTDVFEIQCDKMEFANKASQLGADEFAAFRVLFNRLQPLFGWRV